MLHSIPGSRGEGSGLPSCHQITEVTITQSPPNRSGHMLIDKQITPCILVMFPTREALRQPK